tara:strand:- start:209 stop:424 length:216 start_codon:yes stop_codon:yes gene_type:complete
MSQAIFSTLNKTFVSIAYPFTNIILGAVLFGTATIKVSKPIAPVLVRVKMPTAPVMQQIVKPTAPVYTRIR